MSVNGNHSVKILYGNEWPNAYDQYGLYPGVAGIPSSVPNASYGTVTQYQNGGVSSYNGLTVSLTKRMSHGLSGHFNYTWSHGLDDVSNGGVFTYGDSILGQINPLSLRAGNYGNSDYDIRHLINGDLVYDTPWKFSNRFEQAALGGWQVSTKVYWRTGLPFSVTDTNSALGNGGGTIFATPVLGGGAPQTSCGEGNNYISGVPCVNANAFLNSAVINNFTAWSAQGRNTFRGPSFFDVDMALYKNFKIAERVNFALGLQAFNVLNHPNFYQPDSGYGDSTFGQISSLTSSPTSPYGNFLGFDSAPRVVQISGKITF